MSCLETSRAHTQSQACDVQKTKWIPRVEEDLQEEKHVTFIDIWKSSWSSSSSACNSTLFPVFFQFFSLLRTLIYLFCGYSFKNTPFFSYSALLLVALIQSFYSTSASSTSHAHDNSMCTYGITSTSLQYYSGNNFGYSSLVFIRQLKDAVYLMTVWTLIKKLVLSYIKLLRDLETAILDTSYIF